jgi:hypothetical protein
MMSIFSDVVEKFLEVFMDDFSVFGSSFDNCLHNLSLVLKRCIETNLILSWEKSHFMVQEGIVLGHIVSKRGIEVDRAKVELIENLPPPTSVKQIHSFLGHAGFYWRFIKDFSKISRPLARSQGLCAVCWPRTFHSNLMKLVTRHSISSDLCYPPLPS